MNMTWPKIVSRSATRVSPWVDLIERQVQVKPGSLRNLVRRKGPVDAFRPAWFPHIYHPKMAFWKDERKLLKRKSGALVRPHIIFNHDDRAILLFRKRC